MLEMKHRFSLYLFVMLLILGACTTKDNSAFFPDALDPDGPAQSEAEANRDTDNAVPPSPSSSLEEGHMDRPAKKEYMDALFSAVIGAEIQLPEKFVDSLTVDTIEVIQQGSCTLSVAQSYEYALLSAQGYAHFLCIDTGDAILCHYMGDTFHRFSELYFADIDGDGADEIIAHFYTMAAREPSSASCVLKYENGRINTLLYADGTNVEEQQINCPDLDFEIAFHNGYQYRITNRETGYEKTVDTRNEQGPWEIIFDASGNVNAEHPLYGSSFEKDIPRKNLCLPSNFLLFQPVDIDGDGVFEIVAGQVFEQKIQLSYTFGTACCLLKYSSETEKFEIVTALYLPASERSVLDLRIPEPWLSESKVQNDARLARIT